VRATAPLLLPAGRSAQVAGDGRDLTVLLPLQHSGGDWEPHVRALMARLVQPDWVCLDIGANIGAHTLALASLATDGEVLAFEASRRNFAYLEENVAALSEPKARITTVHCALWDRAGTVDLAESDVFPGGAFVAEESAGLDGSEHVHNIGDRDVTFTLRVDSVPAVRLDDWVAAQGLQRLDLIKLDVEGAETHVLDGAARTLERFRPFLITEYLGVSETYFQRLRDSFPAVQLIEPDGSLNALTDRESLRARLESGKGWEDLLCLPSI
jgi:FkbM family methyltransferase